MGLLYAENGKIFCNEYTEVYIPSFYIDKGVAINKGTVFETFGVLFIKSFPNGKEGKLQRLNIPAIVGLAIHEFKDDTIEFNGSQMNVKTLMYPKGSYVLHQTIVRGREVAESFLAMVLSGKLPKILSYEDLIDLWWKNLEMAGVSFKVPSKILEMILATVYRSPNNSKDRYGQYYGRQSNPTGLDYKTGSVREVVKNLSTFSGMVFEDIGAMITSGINNSTNKIEEPVSPLEKIIHY